jgi:hypothetical protein
LANYNQTVGMSWSTGDFTGDGTVDINDLTIVLANYNTSDASPAAAIAAVPEPSGLVLIGVAVAGLAARASRRRRRGMISAAV